MIETLAGAGLLLILALLVGMDRQRATISRHRFLMREALRKALHDRRHTIKLRAEEVVQAFKIKDVRTLPDPKDYNEKAGGRKHPALERK